MPPALTPGTLYLVATPIGNLEDVTYRAIRVLGAVDLVAAEDTRRTAKLLAHYGLTTRRLSLHEHNEATRIPGLLERLRRGDTVALVSDAGTPLVSDPGQRLARAAVDAGLRVEAIPGPSAVLAALVASGLAADGFTFAGFPPRRSYDRQTWFERLAEEERPVVFFEAPHRIMASLKDLQGSIGDRPVAVCRELTKIHETLVIGPISDVLPRLSELRGEFTVVIGRRTEATEASALPEGTRLLDEFGHITETVRPRRAAVRELADRYGRSTRDVYQALERARRETSGN